MYFFRKKIPYIRKLWASSMVKLVGVKLEEIGSLDTSANIIILNHNSMFDITLLDYLHPCDIAWVTNERLAQVPIFGWIFKFPNLILIDPTKRSSLKVLIHRAKEEVRNKRPLGIFPEGTRGENDDIVDFQKGTKLIAEKLNLNVQPIVLVNTRKRLDTKTFISTPGKIKVIYLDTVDSSEENWFDEMEKSVKETYLKNN
jgi:1-acyl-sn-glycerol-3-phosphate acyltransferase